MIIRSSKINFIQVLLLLSITVIFWITAPFYIKTDNLDLVRGIICILIIILFKFAFSYLNSEYFGKIVAVAAEDSIKIDNKKHKWTNVTRWNFNNKVDLTFGFGLEILNLFFSIMTRTVFIKSSGENIVIYDAPKRLVKCLAKNTAAYDSDFIIKQSYNDII